MSEETIQKNTPQPLSVLLISKESDIFVKDSLAYDRIMSYGKLVEKLYVIVFTTKSQGYKITKLADNIWAYPTNSLFPFSFLHIFGALRLSLFQLTWKFNLEANLVSVEDPFATGLAGLWIAKRNKRRLHVFVSADFLDPYFNEGGILSLWWRAIAKDVVSRAQYITTVSDKIKNSLEQNFSYLKEKISSRTPFIDIEKIAHTPIKTDLRKKYPDLGFIILIASRLSHEKHVERALPILKRLVRVYPKTGMIIVGEGKQRGPLKLLAKAEGLSKHVFFEPPTDDIYSYYKTSHILLSLSQYEDHGMQVIEALACSCPVVGSRVGVASTLFANYKYNEFICPVDDTECFFKKIKDLMEVSGLRDDYKINAKYVVEKELKVSREDYFQGVKEDWQKISLSA
jgi:glycosyltransferase involved in cell wall biosynthesis